MHRVTRYQLWAWRIIWLIAHFVQPLFYRIRIEGAENVPATGGGVVACNHTMAVDWVALGYSSPRELYYMAKAEAFQIHPVFSWIMRSGGVFPVQRGKNDVAALQNAIDLARAGKLIGMFPEGTRSRTGILRRAKGGAARIALEADVPVIPAVVNNIVALRTSWKRFRRPLITVRFGAPLRYEIRPGEDLTLAARRFTERFMSAMAAMLPLEMRGDYAQALGLQVESAAENNLAEG